MSDEREADRARTRNVNSLRFSWHERLIADPELHKGAAALAFAGLVLHRFNAKMGFAEISADYASARLKMPLSTVHRGRRLLFMRGWIAEWQNPRPPKRRRPDMAKRYVLGGGPDDLILEDLLDATDDTPVTDDRPA